MTNEDETLALKRIQQAIHDWYDSLGDDYVLPIEGAKFVEYANEHMNGDLAVWLRMRAPAFVAERFAELARSKRALGLARHRATGFGDAAESGDPDRLVGFLEVPYVVNQAGTQRAFAHMTWDDVDFVAATYEERSASNAFEAAYLRAVQKRLPKSKTVGDAFTEQQLANLRSQTL